MLFTDSKYQFLGCIFRAPSGTRVLILLVLVLDRIHKRWQVYPDQPAHRRRGFGRGQTFCDPRPYYQKMRSAHWQGGRTIFLFPVSGLGLWSRVSYLGFLGFMVFRVCLRVFLRAPSWDLQGPGVFLRGCCSVLAFVDLDFFVCFIPDF